MLASVSIFLLTTPSILAEYIPQGKYIWFNISPAKNQTLGGIFAFECPEGELWTGLFENGTKRCGVP